MRNNSKKKSVICGGPCSNCQKILIKLLDPNESLIAPSRKSTSSKFSFHYFHAFVIQVSETDTGSRYLQRALSQLYFFLFSLMHHAYLNLNFDIKNGCIQAGKLFHDSSSMYRFISAMYR